MAEVGCLKDGMFNNLEVNGSLILSDGSSLSGGSTSKISIVEDPHNGANDVLLTPEMSGSIIKISTANQGNLLLPTPQLGLNYKLVLTALGNYVGLGRDPGRKIYATHDGTIGNIRNLIFGNINSMGNISSDNSKNFISFSTDLGGSSAKVGDYIEIYCVSTSTNNGSNTWFINALTSITSAIVFNT